MFRLFECCALSFFERFVLSFSLKIERFVSDSAEIWICGLYLHRFFHILIGSRNDTYIRMFHFITSYRIKLLFLKDTQKKNLHGIRHITNFIQE